MKNYTLIILILITNACSSTSNVSSNNNSANSFNQFNYDVTCDFVGKQGTQTIVISTIADSEEIALSAARWQGVHAIIYKGLNSGECQVPPLVDVDTYVENQEYFDSLFSTGLYKQFVVSASDSPVDLFYVGKKRVKVFSDVTVDRNALRTRLTKDGIIKSLGDIF